MKCGVWIFRKPVEYPVVVCAQKIALSLVFWTTTIDLKTRSRASLVRRLRRSSKDRRRRPKGQQVVCVLHRDSRTLHSQSAKQDTKHCDFLNTDISQGSVATHLRCGGMFKYDSVANLPLNLPAKEFYWKSVNIWGSYGQEFNVLFFDSRCRTVVRFTQYLTTVLR